MPGFSESERLTIYSQLRTYESDFDKAQSQLRTIASAWSAAVLAAIALITISSVTPVIIPKDVLGNPEELLPLRAVTFLYLRQIICLVGSMGIFAFWFVDQRVYQRLLHSVFAYGLYIELKNADLPQIRTAAYASNLDITRWLGWFYRVQFWAFVLLSFFFVFIASAPSQPAVIISVGHAALCTIGELIANQWSSLKQIVQQLYGELYTAWPDLNDPNAPTTIAWTARVRRNPAQPSAPAIQQH